jgi:hypothetical protein
MVRHTSTFSIFGYQHKYLVGNEPVTVDFVSSDLNEFMNPYTEDDLMSRPPSRMPQKRRDSLNR